MRFKVDENLPEEVAGLLDGAGHDASSISRQGMEGESDPGVASVCQRERRALITLDIGFAEIRTYPPEEYYGLIVLRLVRQDKPWVVAAIQWLLPVFEEEPLENRLWIVEEQRVRIRD